MSARSLFNLSFCLWLSILGLLATRILWIQAPASDLCCHTLCLNLGQLLFRVCQLWP